MLAYLGWIVAAFLGGFLLAHRQWKRSQSLRDNFARVECFHGRGYREILAIAGARPYSITEKANGRIVRVWKEHGYSIALEFDADDMCLGGREELY